jgi:FKBP-type peptidyl-prolyl cis-trans isomerase (trigger factor)
MAKKKSAKKATQKSAKQAKGTSLIGENAKLTITIPKKKAAEAYQQSLEKLAKTVKADGFRQGKVPPKVAEEKLGEAKVIEQALNQLVPDAYRQELEKSKKQPITQPEFSIISTKMGEDWQVEAQFAELPDIKLGKYQKHAKAGLKEAKQAVADQKKAMKEAAKKDKKDDKKQPVPKEMTPEQEKEIKLQHIFRQLVTEIKPQVPELLLKHETQHEFEHMVNQLKQLKVSVDDYLKKRGMDMEQLSQELAVSTLNRLQLDLILGAIARQEKLTVTDKDREEYFKKIPDEKQREQLKKDQRYLSHLDTNLTKQKVVDHLLAS